MLPSPYYLLAPASSARFCADLKGLQPSSGCGEESREGKSLLHALTSSSSRRMYVCPTPRHRRLSPNIRTPNISSRPKRSLSGCPLGFVITDSGSFEVFFLLCEFFQMKGNSLSAYEQNKQQSGASCCALKLSLALFWFSNCC